ncbi:zinc finger MYM-type protein 1-like isoform X2 [Xiphophorus hellerii]|uniref:zinc finger MYM-type protein 1-like isoform X2 n=1 Tax=Xiphophorus hellerii TaxID=8084 RepID=UPI0013B44FF4|nr:zinc finger MYM-type protein 1-like isoform X2 [Xiphophorus hellerii]
MPRKERRQKQKRKELIDAAKGSGLLTDWVRTSTADGQKESDRSEEETKMQSTTQEDRQGEGQQSEIKDTEMQSTQEDRQGEGQQSEIKDTEMQSTQEDRQGEGQQSEIKDTEMQSTQEDRQGEGQQSEINTMDENAEQQVREKPFIFLMDLPHPNDPAHVLQFNIKYDEAFIQNCVNQGPCQPELSFPKNEEGRSFQNKWYKSNPWLEYSPSLNSMFCFSCRVFLNEEKHMFRKSWKTIGLNRWNKALQKIKEHSGSESHMCAMVKWNTFQKKSLEAVLETGNLQSQAAKDKEKQRNREILSRLISITLYLARQGMSFRGDDETSGSLNRGNFLELVELFGKYDSVIKLHLDRLKETLDSNKRPLVSLLSNRTQNDIIKALGIAVRHAIKTEIEESELCSILIDETTDVSHMEQVSFVVRYVHNMQIKERFIQVCNIQSTSGEALENLVLDVLKENNLKMDNIRGQGYDGAANMRGHYKGLQARILRHNPKALYVHCQAHCLNLVLVESAKSNICFVTFFNLVEKLYAFIGNSSKRHTAFIEVQKGMQPHQRPVELQKLSDTRWACRERALKSLKKVLPAVMKFLENMTQESPPDPSAGDAAILLKNINFEFFLCLEITCPIFQVTTVASDALQQKDMDLAAAYKIVEGVLQTLEHCRSEEEFEEMYKKATEKAAAVGLDPTEEVSGHRRKRKVPAKFTAVGTGASDDHVFHTLKESYRAQVYYVFVDSITQELQKRFKGVDNATWEILNALHCLTVPENWTNATVPPKALQALKMLCQFYEIDDQEKLKTELKIIT